MPCGLPTDETIPLARYGGSNVGRAKSVYRMGLGHRYGRRMQTISGIHYNWSLPGVSSEQYFRSSATSVAMRLCCCTCLAHRPRCAPCFVEGREHRLQRLSDSALYLPHATSLRMGRLATRAMPRPPWP